MEVIKYFYIVIFVLGILAQISIIGKDRKPITAGNVIANIIMTAPLIWYLFQTHATF